ncbi:hypothetical protein VNO77_23807 [Canavalia gladiata]|uniref:Uncharacterized protein n=1 Tax=Canavalia gladiata TaxID=3824 RepID=A0AAN9L526_CANGL
MSQKDYSLTPVFQLTNTLGVYHVSTFLGLCINSYASELCIRGLYASPIIKPSLEAEKRNKDLGNLKKQRTEGESMGAVTGGYEDDVGGDSEGWSGVTALSGLTTRHWRLQRRL